MTFSFDEKFLVMAEILAKNHPDQVSTSPRSVGAIIVKDGKIVGTGYRWTKVLQEEPFKDITYHAEHCAIMNAGPLCKDATLYVTMEPCTKRIHYGWPTPDCCCDLIVKSGIKRVVYLESDNGLGTGGEEELKKRGIEVEKSTYN
jgi:pyrimidine deaminase RibD-like protein